MKQLIIILILGILMGVFIPGCGSQVDKNGFGRTSQIRPHVLQSLEVAANTQDLSELTESAGLPDYLTYAALNNAGLEAAFNRWQAAQVQQQRYQAIKQSLFFAVKEAYYEYYYLAKAIAITEENVNLLKHLESVARIRFKVAAASHPDVIRAQVELGKLQDRHRALQDLRAPTIARLNAALNRPVKAELPEPGLCPICNMDLIPLETDETTEMTNMRQLVVSETAKALMDVETAPVEHKFVSSIIRMVGKVDYDETRLAYITAWIPGRLDRLFVDYTGVPVQKGDHLVSLYSPELLSAQEELIQALKSLESIKASELSIMRKIAEATVVAARDKLRLWGLTPEQIANIEKTGKVSDHMTIYAPTGGIVIHKNALEGMYVKEGAQIYTIADLSRVWVKLDAYESDLEWLRYGQNVEFTTVAYPGETFTGTIAFIDPILNERTRTVKVRVNVPNAQGKLKPEMFVKAVARPQIAGGGRIMDASLAGKWICPMHPDIVKDGPDKCDICEMPLVRTESLGYVSDDPAQAQKPLVIPVTAALVTGTRAIVYVLVPDTEKPSFEGREIVLGPRAGDYYLVRGGLKGGERVVVRGNFKIDSALQIMAKPSMMTPGGGGSQKTSQDDALPGLSALVRYQLQDVMAAAAEVNKALGAENLSQAQTAFADVDKAIKSVDMELLDGQPHMWWMELSMRLANDALEGSSAATLPEARRVAKLLDANMASLRNKFGLKHGREAAARPVLSQAFRDQLAEVFAAYFTLQKALADDDQETASQAVNQMLTSLKNVDMNLITGENHTVWMQVSSELEKIIGDTIQINDIKIIRENFYLLSQDFIKLAQRFGAPGTGPYYTIHCPMAFDNNGADWLQLNDEVRNPYFGALMLQCGEVTAVVPVARIQSKKDS